MPAKINFKALTTSAEFKAAAVSIAKRNASTKRDMQSALVCALEHMNVHGNYLDTIMPLIEVGGSFGKNLEVALMEWVLKFSWLAYTDKKWHKDQTKVMDLEKAKSTDWWTMERAAKAKPFDFQKALEDLFTKITDELAKPDTILDRNTVFSAVETKMRDIIPVEDQISALFDRLNDADKFAMATQFMMGVPAPTPAPEPEEVPEPEQAAA